ncbi:unnamed protein product, partial [Aureobasidium vineae]
ILYEVSLLELNQTKEPQYLELNPNGRLPSIRDPNTRTTHDLTNIPSLELSYCISSISTIKKKSSRTRAGHKRRGPYFGQATWFARFHPEKLPTAIDRYVNEIERVLGVLDTALRRGNTAWLVGDKCTYADISFVTWAATGEGLLRELEKDKGLAEKHPHYSTWFAALKERSTIGKALQEIAAQRKAHGLP